MAVASPPGVASAPPPALRVSDRAVVSATWAGRAPVSQQDSDRAGGGRGAAQFASRTPLPEPSTPTSPLQLSHPALESVPWESAGRTPGFVPQPPGMPDAGAQPSTRVPSIPSEPHWWDGGAQAGVQRADAPPRPHEAAWLAQPYPATAGGGDTSGRGSPAAGAPRPPELGSQSPPCPVHLAAAYPRLPPFTEQPPQEPCGTIPTGGLYGAPPPAFPPSKPLPPMAQSSDANFELDSYRESRLRVEQGRLEAVPSFFDGSGGARSQHGLPPYPTGAWVAERLSPTSSPRVQRHPHHPKHRFQAPPDPPFAHDLDVNSSASLFPRPVAPALARVPRAASVPQSPSMWRSSPPQHDAPGRTRSLPAVESRTPSTHTGAESPLAAGLDGQGSGTAVIDAKVAGAAAVDDSSDKRDSKRPRLDFNVPDKHASSYLRWQYQNPDANLGVKTEVALARDRISIQVAQRASIAAVENALASLGQRGLAVGPKLAKAVAEAAAEAAAAALVRDPAKAAQQGALATGPFASTWSNFGNGPSAAFGGAQDGPQAPMDAGAGIGEGRSPSSLALATRHDARLAGSADELGAGSPTRPGRTSPAASAPPARQGGASRRRAPSPPSPRRLAPRPPSALTLEIEARVDEILRPAQDGSGARRARGTHTSCLQELRTSLVSMLKSDEEMRSLSNAELRKIARRERNKLSAKLSRQQILDKQRKLEEELAELQNEEVALLHAFREALEVKRRRASAPRGDAEPLVIGSNDPILAAWPAAGPLPTAQAPSERRSPQPGRSREGSSPGRASGSAEPEPLVGSQAEASVKGNRAAPSSVPAPSPAADRLVAPAFHERSAASVRLLAALDGSLAAPRGVVGFLTAEPGHISGPSSSLPPGSGRGELERRWSTPGDASEPAGPVGAALAQPVGALGASSHSLDAEREAGGSFARPVFAACASDLLALASPACAPASGTDSEPVPSVGRRLSEEQSAFGADTRGLSPQQSAAAFWAFPPQLGGLLASRATPLLGTRPQSCEPGSVERPHDFRGGADVAHTFA